MKKVEYVVVVCYWCMCVYLCRRYRGEFLGFWFGDRRIYFVFELVVIIFVFLVWFFLRADIFFIYFLGS